MSKKLKHTPGPWEIHGDSECLTINTDTQAIARLYCGNQKDAPGGLPESLVDKTDWANARLVAAAPELLMCCEATLTYLHLENHLDKDQLIIELNRVLNEVSGGFSDD